MARKQARKKTGDNTVTPMMRQYGEIRAKLPANTLLLFRLGDFYEMFDEDAERGARLLEITLTHRNGKPMAGIPYHAADSYIARVLRQGVKVAICDQVETPQPGKIVRRELTRILSPGTTLEDHQVEARRNHYLLACHWEKRRLVAAWLDLTSGEFQIAVEEQPERLAGTLAALDAREIILPEEASAKWKDDEGAAAWRAVLARLTEDRPISDLPDYHFETTEGARLVMQTLGVLNLDGFGLTPEHPALGVAGALIYYATESLCARPANLHRIREYTTKGAVLLDPATQRNLEIFRSAQGQRDGSLLGAMDATRTAAGARLLERWLAHPERDLGILRARHDLVGELVADPAGLAELREALTPIRDLARILGRMQNRLRNPREFGGIRETLNQLPHLEEAAARITGDRLADLRGHLTDFPQLRRLLNNALEDELPNQVQEGGYIRNSFDAELDRLRGLLHDSKTWVANLEAQERERTGIKNLRIKYNGAFGYFLEVTKANAHLVPDEYVRKQTMTNAERYYTPALKEKEKEILHAEEKAIAREEELFEVLKEKILEEAANLRAVAQTVAELDVFAGWAHLARTWDYGKPQIDDSGVLEIEQGRHPVVEQRMRAERLGLGGTHAFVPNDTFLAHDEAQIAILTGPNMAGKSTYIRQVALIALMAQTGSWVPASRCHLGLVDRIFSRVGASDELARGNSTFMVEMNETANILNHATDRSLIILDEIGRGTSTYDGLSIAWAVVEHLHGEDGSGPRTLFATHYHEITQIADELARVRNYRVAVKEWNNEIIFIRQVTPGAADRSYGIQVARLAGLPPTVITRAEELLARLEGEDSSHNLRRQRSPARKATRSPDRDRSRQEAREPEPGPGESQLALF